MGFITALMFSGWAFAQGPDWNRQLPDSKANGLPEFLENPPEGIGLGVHVGRPLSLAASFYKKPFITQALLGMGLPNTYRFSVDQLYAVYHFQMGEYLSFPINVGLGGFAYFNEKSSGDFIAGGGTTYNHYGIRMPLNVAFNHQELAFDVYTEIVPVLQLTPQIAVDVYGGFGVRVYPFNQEK